MIQGFLLLLLLIFIIPIFLLAGFLGRLFRPRGQQNPTGTPRGERQRSTWHNTQTTNRKKRIEDGEGEYIDFEEIEDK